MSRWILIPETFRFRQHLVHTFLYVLKGQRGRSERRWTTWDGEMWYWTAERGAEQYPRQDAQLSPLLSHTHARKRADSQEMNKWVCPWWGGAAVMSSAAVWDDKHCFLFCVYFSVRLIKQCPLKRQYMFANSSMTTGEETNCLLHLRSTTL